MDLDKAIQKAFRVKRRDTLPYSGWGDTTRKDLAVLMGKQGLKYGAEIGICKGDHALRLFKHIPGLKLIGVDPWHAYNKVSARRARARYDKAVKVMAPYNIELMKMTSMEAVREIPLESLDFVYIDGAHDFDSVIMDLVEWSRRVRPGGIVAGHDYCPMWQGGVIAAVNAYTCAHNLHNWYVTREKTASYFWVKQKNIFLN